MKYFVTALAMIALLSTPAHAIRVVGNGGGESELKVQTQYQALPAWILFCRFQLDVCFANTSHGKSALAKIAGKFNQTQDLLFVNAKSNQQQTAKSIVLTHESLYIDDKTPREDVEIFQVLISAMAGENVDVFFAPKIRKHPRLPVWVMTADGEDYLVAQNPEIQIHEQLSEHLGSGYLIQSTTANGYLIERTSDHQTFEIQLRFEGDKLHIKMFARD